MCCRALRGTIRRGDLSKSMCAYTKTALYNRRLPCGARREKIRNIILKRSRIACVGPNGPHTQTQTHAQTQAQTHTGTDRHTQTRPRCDDAMAQHTLNSIKRFLLTQTQEHAEKDRHTHTRPRRNNAMAHHTLHSIKHILPQQAHICPNTPYICPNTPFTWPNTPYIWPNTHY